MKRITPLFSTICLLALVFYSSCEKKATSTVNEVAYDSIQIDETYFLFNDSTKPSCNLKIHFIFPQSYPQVELLSKMQDLFTTKLLGEKFGNLSPKLAVESYKEQYINEFKRFESDSLSVDLFDSEDTEDETGYSYYARIKNAIVFNQNKLISFTVEYQNYEGGAHGSRSIYGYVLDLNTGKLVQENQFFGDNYKKDVATLIVSKIAEKNGEENPKNLENIGFNSIEEIVPNGNFTVDDKGITYYYNENEIAAYVVGISQVFLPFDEINIYMKKDSPISSLIGF